MSSQETRMHEFGPSKPEQGQSRRPSFTEAQFRRDQQEQASSSGGDNESDNPRYTRWTSPGLPEWTTIGSGQGNTSSSDTSHSDTKSTSPSNKSKGLAELGNSQGSVTQIDRGHAEHLIHNVMPHEGGETVDTIDDKINALDNKTLSKVSRTTERNKTQERVLPETNQHAVDLYNAFKTTKEQNYFIKHDLSRYDKTQALIAYNDLKSKYDNGALNDTAKDWYRKAGFDYAQD